MRLRFFLLCCLFIFVAGGHDYYKTLGVKKTATEDQIKKSFKKLARKYHPDVNRSKGASEKMKKINEAYTTLSDPKARQTYDLGGGPGNTRPQPGRAGRKTGGGGWGGFDFGNFNFGGGGGRAGNQRTEHTKPNFGGGSGSGSGFNFQFGGANNAREGTLHGQRPPAYTLYKNYSPGSTTELGPLLRRGSQFKDLDDLSRLTSRMDCYGFVVDPSKKHARLIRQIGVFDPKSPSPEAWSVYVLNKYGSKVKGAVKGEQPKKRPSSPYFRSQFGYKNGKYVGSPLQFGREWRSYDDLSRLAAKTGAVAFVELNGMARLLKSYDKVDSKKSWPVYEMGTPPGMVTKQGLLYESTPQVWDKFCSLPSTMGCLFYVGSDDHKARTLLTSMASKYKHQLFVIIHPDQISHFATRLFDHLGAPKPLVGPYAVLVHNMKGVIKYSVHTKEMNKFDLNRVFYKKATNQQTPSPW